MVYTKDNTITNILSSISLQEAKLTDQSSQVNNVNRTSELGSLIAQSSEHQDSLEKEEKLSANLHKLGNYFLFVLIKLNLLFAYM